MALSPAFTVTNNAGVSQNTFTVTDTSTGSDGAITDRQILIYQVSNDLLPNTPVDFPLSAGSSISPAILSKDYAVNIVLNWLDVSGNILYTTSNIFVFTGFLEWSFYSLTQKVAAQNSLMNDVVFFDNWSKLRTLIDSANQSITIGASIYNAQYMLSLAQLLTNNMLLYF